MDQLCFGGNQRAQQALPVCSVLRMSTDAHDCSGHLAMTVRAVTASSDPDVASTVDLLDVNAGRWRTYFDSDQALRSTR